MSTSMTILSVLAFTFLYFAHVFVARRNAVLDARGQLRGQLYRRYELIELMFTIVRVHVPEYGAMLEKLIIERLKAAKKLDEKTSDEMHEEVFNIMSSLIESPGYVTFNDETVRQELRTKLVTAETNIKAAQSYYFSTVSYFNAYATLLGRPELEIYSLPKNNEKQNDFNEETFIQKLRISM